MNIWIDGYEANVSQRLGSSKVGFELLKSLEKIDKENDYTILLPSNPLDDLPKERDGWKYKILKPKKLWTRIALPLALLTASQKPDLFYSPTHYLPAFIPAKIKKIVTVFDLSFLRFPETFLKRDLWQLKNWTEKSASSADKIITISNSTKKDIIKSYQIRKDKIIVAYPGFDKSEFKPRSKIEIEKIEKKYQLKDNYIIYIGTIQPKKNLVRLIEAVSKIENITLVIVGKHKSDDRGGWNYQETLETPKKLGIEGRVKFLGFVPQDDLSYLYSGAKVFAMPSLWEGFGIPIVEAMACGTPVVVSNVASLPEVAGKAGLLVDPYSIDQIEQALRVLIFDKKMHLKFSKAALKQSKKFSWDKMAKIVLKVFEDLD